jgi:hypothetical protein
LHSPLRTSAPLAVFAFNRPEHLRRTLTALLSCEGVDQTPITVFIDGPRSPKDTAAVAATRRVAEQMLGGTATIKAAGANQGLARSITSGVSELVEKHGRVIVLEDDLEVSRGFLTYMNSALDRYAENESVFQISGHMFDVPEFRSRTDAVCLPFTTTWGWATWARAWKIYDPAATGWEALLADPQRRRRFDLNGAYPYSAMLVRQMRGRLDSWGIRWYWSVFKVGGVSIFPPQTMVRNTGLDGSGTHGRGRMADFGQTELRAATAPLLLAACPIVDPADFAQATRAIWRLNGGWRGVAMTLLRQLLDRLPERAALIAPASSNGASQSRSGKLDTRSKL